MTKSYICPFCNNSFPLIDATHKTYVSNFKNSYANNPRIWSDNFIDINKEDEPIFISPSDETPELMMTSFYKCPNCEKVTIIIKGVGKQYPEDYSLSFYPSSTAKQYPNYVPKAIIEDYEEAYKIHTLSPKASATLSRRCIQGMIRDIFNTNKNTLFEEINAIKDKVNPETFKALDSVRKIGNIGAHMEKDINLIVPIDANEATILIKLVEILIKDWYIDPHEKEMLLNQIISISEDKQALRKENN